MPQIDVNYWAVLAGTAVAMVLGYLWYGKPLFATTWMNLIGKKESDLKDGSSMAMIKAVVLAFITVYVLAHIVGYANAETWVDGMVAGAWVWFGFVLTTLMLHDSFEQRPLKLTMINAGYHLVHFLIAGAMLAVWQ